MDDFFEHSVYNNIFKWKEIDHIIYPQNPEGLAVICIGAGLMMATVDALEQAGKKVHCAVDVGKLNIDDMVDVMEWACHVKLHTGVVIHTWHSRSSAAKLIKRMGEINPTLLSGGGRRLVHLRVRGFEEDLIASSVKNNWTIEDLIKDIK